jgi:hypothetical protein
MFLIPIVILCIISANFIWETLKKNLAGDLLNEWPWKLAILDGPTSANMVAIMAGLLLARDQFSRSVAPAIGFNGDEGIRSSYVIRSAWTVHITNSGSGRCIVTEVRYRYRLTSSHGLSAKEGWLDWEGLVDELRRTGLHRNRDFYLRNIGIGLTIPSSPLPLWELAAFNRAALRRMSSLELHLRFKDVLGDEYERRMNLLHTAHTIHGGIPRYRYLLPKRHK